MTKAWIFVVLGASVALSLSCSDKHAPGVSTPEGGANGSVGGRTGHSGSANSNAGHAPGGASDGDAGASAGGEDSNAAGAGGTQAAGTAGTSPLGGTGGGPNPPVGDPPICAHDAMHGAGTRLALSGAGNDLLQAITPDELTIAWKNGNDFYVADRATTSDDFGASQQVTGGSQFTAVSLSADGLTLIGVTKLLSVLEVKRQPASAFDAASASPGNFQQFDTALSMVPSSNQAMSDAIVSPDETSFFFSYYVHYQGDPGGYPTINESHRSGDAWTFGSVPLGEVLDASDDKRRIPTGVSSDLLTLFYRDEVKGDFRAAWRVNRQVKFDYSEVVNLGQGITAVAPSVDCSKLYYSGPGTNDLDVFVAEVTN